MASTQIQTFALGGSANVLSPTAYAALTTLLSNGYQSGIANSQQINTTLRQTSFMSAALANFLVSQNVTQNDDGNLSGAVTNIQTAIQTFTNTFTRLKLAGNASYYVTTTGNDSSAGTSGSPWLTIQHAVNYINTTIDLAGYTATINVADGTYTGAVTVNAPFTGGGVVQITGDNTTPANCIISTTGNCFGAFNGAQYNISGFKVVSSAGAGVTAVGTGSTITVNGNFEFGACSTVQMLGQSGGVVNCYSDSYKISGAATNHLSAINNGIVFNYSDTVTITGTPAFTAFANAGGGGAIFSFGNTYSGSATGLRYSATLNGVINTSGGGASYFPGGTAGTTATGGQYA